MPGGLQPLPDSRSCDIINIKVSNSGTDHFSPECSVQISVHTALHAMAFSFSPIHHVLIPNSLSAQIPWLRSLFFSSKLLTLSPLEPRPIENWLPHLTAPPTSAQQMLQSPFIPSSFLSLVHSQLNNRFPSLHRRAVSPLASCVSSQYSSHPPLKPFLLFTC